jgi:hypothetical protein
MKLRELRFFACILLGLLFAAGCSAPFIAASIEGKRGNPGLESLAGEDPAGENPAGEDPTGKDPAGTNPAGDGSDEVSLPFEFEW